jgi:hypothetical protein
VFVNTEFLLCSVTWSFLCAKTGYAKKNAARKSGPTAAAAAIDEWNKALIFCQYILLARSLFTRFLVEQQLFSHQRTAAVVWSLFVPYASFALFSRKTNGGLDRTPARGT